MVWCILVLGDFPKLGVPVFGVPIIRTIVRGLYWGPLFGELPFRAKGLGYRVWEFGFRDLRVEFLAARNHGV